MSRERKVHWRQPVGANMHFTHCSPRGYTWNRLYTTDLGAVTCLVCLYHLGLYMPLVKLREHQIENRRIWEHANTW